MSAPSSGSICSIPVVFGQQFRAKFFVRGGHLEQLSWHRRFERYKKRKNIGAQPAYTQNSNSQKIIRDLNKNALVRRDDSDGAKALAFVSLVFFAHECNSAGERQITLDRCNGCNVSVKIV